MFQVQTPSICHAVLKDNTINILMKRMDANVESYNENTVRNIKSYSNIYDTL